MRAVLLTGHGGFETLEYREDVPTPVPAAGEVLVCIRAAAVNNTDINARTAWYSKSVRAATDGQMVPANANADDAGWTGAAMAFPRIQGADGCGEIVAVGAGVATTRIGSRVLLDPVLRATGAAADSFGYIGTDRDGCFAEFVAVPDANACAVSSKLSDVELASFPCSYIAAENMLARAAVGAQQKVLISGASGGVGSAAVQLARRRGANIIAIASADKSAALRALGASRVLPRDANLLVELGRESIDAVIDCVGGAQFSSYLQILCRTGRYAVAGAIAGPLVELDLRTLYLKDLTLSGCTIPDPGLFTKLIGYIERGEIRPLVAKTYVLRDMAAAQQEFLTKQHVGKIVLSVAPASPAI